MLLMRIWGDGLTVFWGEWLDLRVRLPQVFAAGLVSPLIYILAFGFGLGSSMAAPPVGASYLEFILPGMVALSSMIISFAGTTFSICGDRLFTKTFEELLLAPVHPLGVYLGKVMAGVVRGLLTALAIMIISVIFTGNGWGFLNPLFLFLVLLNCLVFSGLGVIVGLSVTSLETVGLYNNFLIVPMSFLGGTFFDPSTVPNLLKAVVYLIPLTYASIGLRASALGGEFPWYAPLVLLVMAMVLAAIGAYQFAHQQD
ncbi:ABC-2 transporter, permease [Gloeomargarita lithophora Alchichica-D10]|uniref:Transport permease protein n=1 Tax=Gloeomargarita lithophora Alchichica-D10 TaxID=1188229 RepID=A0A1J0ABZ4_9CYAN|nr:ABC transporter permease [Gloeomargarita lithophora]APB33450.1 ABC-2 transporter, permease [Gloeomargarita lithophora Alchichica-D10]